MKLALCICACWLCMSEGARITVNELKENRTDELENGFPWQAEVCGAIKDDEVKNSVVSSVCAVQGDVTGVKPPSWTPQWLKNGATTLCEKALGVAWDQAIGCVCDGIGVRLDEHMCPYFYKPCEPPEEKCNNDPANIEESVKFLTVKAIRDTACHDDMRGTAVGNLCITGWDATWHIVWNSYDYVIGCVCDSE